jgi:hypothetical protein
MTGKEPPNSSKQLDCRELCVRVPACAGRVPPRPSELCVRVPGTIRQPRAAAETLGRHSDRPWQPRSAAAKWAALSLSRAPLFPRSLFGRSRPPLSSPCPRDHGGRTRGRSQALHLHHDAELLRTDGGALGAAAAVPQSRNQQLLGRREPDAAAGAAIRRRPLLFQHGTVAELLLRGAGPPRASRAWAAAPPPGLAPPVLRSRGPSAPSARRDGGGHRGLLLFLSFYLLVLLGAWVLLCCPGWPRTPRPKRPSCPSSSDS